MNNNNEFDIWLIVTSVWRHVQSLATDKPIAGDPVF